MSSDLEKASEESAANKYGGDSIYEGLHINGFLAGSAHTQAKESKIRRELQDHLRESNRGNERISLRLEKQVEYSLELKKKLTIAMEALEEIKDKCSAASQPVDRSKG